MRIKPCPFCGAIPKLYWEQWKEISETAGASVLEANHDIKCFIRLMDGMNFNGRMSGLNKKHLVEVWNRRASKSNFIELPCNVGDKYFTINTTCSCGGYETKGEYLPHDSDCDGCHEDCDKEYIIKEHTFNTVLDIMQKEKGLGWCYFLTYEEAEAKQKERR